MSAEGLLTVLGLLLAVLAVLSPERRLDLWLRLTGVDWLIIAIMTGFVHVVLFAPVLHRWGLLPDWGPWRGGLTAETASYGVLALGASALAWRARRPRLRVRTVPALRDLATRLLLEQKWSEAIYLLERYLDVLVRYNEGGW